MIDTRRFKMKLVVVGINHKDTPLEIREKGAFIRRTINEGNQ
jgi:glutamyl-tRNA reductase